MVCVKGRREVKSFCKQVACLVEPLAEAGKEKGSFEFLGMKIARSRKQSETDLANLLYWTFTPGSRV